ncbi:DUF3568 family protein [Phycisphaerales bacterium AB-hyl4]|uniref:DUF3568 family protein n=1 Tax=Natronomicrosphaera hydrolytica TaxID=3242702 RepID=A0ABV4U4S9_9BACT
MMRQLRSMASVCLLMAMTLAVGCATPMTSELPGENVTYTRQATQGDVRADVDSVIEAAESVMALMQMDIGEVELREGAHVLPGRTSTGRMVRITVFPYEDEQTSQLRVRIGSFGDQQLSNELYRRIVNRLE